MEYIFGIWSIKDSCNECRNNTFPGYEDTLQRQPQEHRPGLLFFLVWMNFQHHELEVDYSVHVVYSLHAHKYMLSSTYQMRRNGLFLALHSH